jgi:serine/threonine-protein phosphatase 2A regulatory subunit B''
MESCADQLVLRLPEIESYFKPYPNGIPFENFVHITKGLCGLPSFFNLPLCRRITLLYPPSSSTTTTASSDKSSSKSSRSSHQQPPPQQQQQPAAAPNRMTLKTFLLYWQHEIEPYDRYERFFRLVKQPAPSASGGGGPVDEVNYIMKDDFVPFIQELLHFHPGLEFLENHDEFQRKYALTVIARIFYKVNLSRTGKISLRELYSSNLIHEFMHVDEETDINRVTEYFSYEHFYVLYCRFFELDNDKDSKLTRDDLLKYGEHSLSEAIIDRSDGPSPPPPPLSLLTVTGC